MHLPLVLSAVLAAAVATTPFTPSIVKPSSIVAYRNATQGNGVGTLYAVAADGYSDGAIVVADLAGTPRVG
jgi:hypothetical protein